MNKLEINHWARAGRVWWTELQLAVKATAQGT